MNIAELLTKYGGDDVQCQPLDGCADRMNVSGSYTKITFGTPEPLGPNGTVKMGIVVWMDRDRVAEILAADKAASASSDNGADGTKSGCKSDLHPGYVPPGGDA